MTYFSKDQTASSRLRRVSTLTRWGLAQPTILIVIKSFGPLPSPVPSSTPRDFAPSPQAFKEPSFPSTLPKLGGGCSLQNFLTHVTVLIIPPPPQNWANGAAPSKSLVLPPLHKLDKTTRVVDEDEASHGVRTPKLPERVASEGRR